MDLLIGHLVGDYICQNDFLAENKKKSHFWCLLHCLGYAWLIMCACPQLRYWPVYLIIVISHFLIDRWNFVRWFMKKNGQIKFMEPPLGPWSVIIVDNTFHLFILWALNEITTKI